MLSPSLTVRDPNRQLLTTRSDALESQMANSLRQEDRVETLTGVAGERDSVAARYNRIKAKYGDQSPQAAVGAAWLELLDREFAELEAQRIREFIPAPQTAGNRFIVYGRILDGEGVGVPHVTVAARSLARTAASPILSG